MPHSESSQPFPPALTQVLALIFIFLGVLWLFSILGWLKAAFWSQLQILWPVLIILAGARLALSRSKQANRKFAALTAFVFLIILLRSLSPARLPARSLTTPHFFSTLFASKPALSAGRLELPAPAPDSDPETPIVLNLNLGSGSLTIDHHVVPAALDLKYSGAPSRPTLESGVQGTNYAMTITNPPSSLFAPKLPRYRLALGQSSHPTELSLTHGTGTVILDTSQLHLARLTVNHAAGTVNLYLTETTPLDANLTLWLGSLNLHVPSDLKLVLNYHTGWGQTRFHGRRLSGAGQLTLHPEATIAARIDARVTTGTINLIAP